MLQNVPISEIMTEEIEVVEQDQNIKDVLNLLAEYSVQHIPVIGDGELVGLVSSSDIMDHSIALLNGSRQQTDVESVEHTCIEQIMSTELIILSIDSTVLDAAEILSGGNIHSIPIVDNSNSLVGIVTSTDLIKFLMNQLQLDL